MSGSGKKKKKTGLKNLNELVPFSSTESVGLQEQPQSYRKEKKPRSDTTPFVPGEWLGDGKDHICIDPSAATSLGRDLSIYNNIHWKHPVLGNFRSLENLWLFLSVEKPHESLRTLPRMQALDLARRECGGLDYYPNIEAVFVDSMWRYFKTRRNLVNALKQSTLPFDIYYVNGAGIRCRRPVNVWLVAVYEEIRAAFREDREPNLSRWITRQEEHPYHDIMTALGVDPSKTMEMFKKAVSGENRSRGAESGGRGGRVIKERTIRNIDPTPGFVVKVREAGSKEAKPLIPVSEVVTEVPVEPQSEPSAPGAVAETLAQPEETTAPAESSTEVLLITQDQLVE